MHHLVIGDGCAGFIFEVLGGNTDRLKAPVVTYWVVEEGFNIVGGDLCEEISILEHLRIEIG